MSRKKLTFPGLSIIMTNNELETEQQKTFNTTNEGRARIIVENGEESFKYLLGSEIGDSDVELVDSSIDSIDVNQQSGSRSSRNTDHGLEYFVSETITNKKIECKLPKEKDMNFNEIRNENLLNINDSSLVASNSKIMRPNLVPPSTSEDGSFATSELSSIYNGNNRLALAPEQKPFFCTEHEPKFMDIEDLKALPLNTSTASSSPRCSNEQIWPSSQDNMAMFDISDQNKQESSINTHNPFFSGESTEFNFSPTSNKKVVTCLSQDTKPDENNLRIEDRIIISNSNDNKLNVGVEASFRRQQSAKTDLKSVDVPEQKLLTPITTLSTNSDVYKASLQQDRINNNTLSTPDSTKELHISSSEQLVSMEPILFSKNEHSVPVSHIAANEGSSLSLVLPRSALTTGLQNSEAVLTTKLISSMAPQVSDTEQTKVFVPTASPRSFSLHENVESSPSSGLSISNTSSPPISEVSPERAREVMLAELKAIKIASITTRNTALEAELAIKNARLEEITRELRVPAQETVRRHIKLLHDYNDIRDIGQGLIGMIAEQRGVQIGSLYEDYGVGLKD
ncbi:putative dna repair protein swi5 [Erysiphe necator]|uniref:Putative dna repair protein swi5 n=1 Tax=Uncinula necator TaxID=52586 RepID=A0A0B1PEW5_UNCNE|nr:putative dna repair protein swi5 [Erysiphe necator]